MKKFLALNFFCLTVFSTLLFILVLNFRYGIFSADKIKSIASTSNVYEVTAAKVREILLDNNGEKIDDGPAFDIINAAVTPSSVKTIAEKSVDQFFSGLVNSKDGIVLTFSLSEIDAQIKSQIEKVYGPSNGNQGQGALALVNQADNINFNIPYNPAFKYLAHFSYIVLSLGLICFLSAVFLFFLAGKTLSHRMVWVGSAYFIVSLFLITLIVGVKYLLPTYLSQIASNYNGSDQKIIVAIEKITNSVVDNQIIFLIVETIFFGLLGLFMIWFGRGVKEEKVDLLN